MSRVVIKYRVTCLNGDGNVETDFLEELPTVCPLDANHGIDTDSIVEIDRIAENISINKDDDSGTNGIFLDEGYDIAIASDGNPGNITTYDISYDWNIIIKSVYFDIRTENLGDVVNVYTNPTTIGATTSITSIGSTEIDVSQNVIDNIILGFLILLKDNSTEECIGQCKVIDTINNKITITSRHGSPGNTIEYPIGSEVIMAVPRTLNHKFVITGRDTLGQDHVGGSFFPVGSVARINYINNGTVAKEFNIKVQSSF